ncbi:hypothetical protein F4780DRAFT_772161 [Xylariomycetidae sp. FL0641]|nr:hypothetical protein F4780DRAFT_772161 [Xylariomycetidae sp. FL0641]
MATAPAAPGPKKLSFAKVVASSPKENVPPVSAARVAVPAMDRRTQSPATPAATAMMAQGANSPAAASDLPHGKVSSPSEDRAAPTQRASEATEADKLVSGMKNMNVSSTAVSAGSTPSLVVNGSTSSPGNSPNKNDNGTSVSDDVSQKADSNSEMGTKAPSLDGKSITSGTTFALDEKESLRPDDSASVKAAAEDDEPYSIRGSMIANSRMGSDVARVHRLRIGDMPERRIVQLLPETQQAQGVATPQSAASGPQAPPEQPQALAVNGSNDAFNSIYGKNPDEKLLEAMQSPKDRIFLLRLEQDVINFVQSSKEPYMDLPPNNSFCRMLTHKLADYYHMTHSFEAVQGAVRIYRTPFCRVPPSLASIVETTATSNTETPPPVVLPKKIMRRGEEGGSGQASTSASKATSEVGSDGKEKAPTREKMTREEREEFYNKTRERIFGNTEKTGESTPGLLTLLKETDDINGVSRASSVSGRERSNLGKRGKVGKQRRDDSESFESRSQFVPLMPPQSQMNWAPHFVSPGAMPYGEQMQQAYAYPVPATYQTPPQGFAPMMPNNGYPQYNAVPTYPQQAQPAPTRYAPSNVSVGGAYGPPTQATPPQSWQPTFNQAPSPGPFPSRVPQSQTPGNSAPPGSVPYAYGQLPANANPRDPKSQHPIPGSYNRHAFNPKTVPFVPGNGMSSGQPPMYAPQPVPQVGSPHLGYNGFSSAMPAQPYMGGPGYGMSRQSSNNSLPPYHQPPHHPQPPSAHLPPMPQMPQMPQIPQMSQMAKPGMPQGPSVGPGQPFSHLPNYGNPATLPQKPPSGI